VCAVCSWEFELNATVYQCYASCIRMTSLRLVHQHLDKTVVAEFFVRCNLFFSGFNMFCAKCQRFETCLISLL